VLKPPPTRFQITIIQKFLAFHDTITYFLIDFQYYSSVTLPLTKTLFVIVLAEYYQDVLHLLVTPIPSWLIL